MQQIEDILGLRAGEAHIIRTGGGRVQDAIRGLVPSQQLLGTIDVAVVHHTDCACSQRRLS